MSVSAGRYTLAQQEKQYKWARINILLSAGVGPVSTWCLGSAALAMVICI